MGYRRAGIPVAVDVVETDAHIQTRAAHIGRGDGGVVAFLGIGLRAIELLTQHTHLDADAEHTSQQFGLECILHGETLVVKEAQFVARHLHAHTMVMLEHEQGHIGSDNHSTRVVLETGKVEGVTACDIQLGLFAHGGGVEHRLLGKVVAERHIILRRGGQRPDDRDDKGK